MRAYQVTIQRWDGEDQSHGPMDDVFLAGDKCWGFEMAHDLVRADVYRWDHVTVTIQELVVVKEDVEVLR